MKRPAWLTEDSYRSLAALLLPGEEPGDMYRRLSSTASRILKKPEIEEKLFQCFWNGWLCPATPVASNFGVSRGLPISCLTGDMLINTYGGGKYMKDIQIGDKVLTHENRWRAVSDIKKSTSEDIYELVVGLRTTKIRITGNHPVLTNLGWVRVDELTENHLVATNMEAEYPETEYTIKLSSYCKYEYKIEENKILKLSTNKLERKKPEDGVVSYYAQPYDEIKVDEELSWALGLWFAEGSVATNYGDPNGVKVTLGWDEEHLAIKWLDIMKKKFNLNGAYEKVERPHPKFPDRTNKWINAYVSSVLVGQYFHKEFGKNCKVKKLPIWLLELPKAHLKQFLDAFALGDGHLTEITEKCQITISNPELCLGLYNISLKLKTPVSLALTAKAGRYATTRYVYTIIFLQEYKTSLRQKSINSGIQFGKLVYSPIKSLKKLTKSEEVYDITVAEDHSFSVCGVVVHNCYSLSVPDSIDGIFSSVHELAMMSKNGGGVGFVLSNVRERNAIITGNGRSEGVIPWLKVFDVTTVAVSQGSVRRGASAAFLSVHHGDIEEFIDIRRPTGDINRQCLNLNHGVVIDDAFMRSVEAREPKATKLWKKILKARFETGEPYLMFEDTINRANPECYKQNGLKVTTSNICTEICGHTDDLHSFVCCLSSLNLMKWEEWKDTDTVELAIYFLDAVMEEFIQKAAGIPMLDRAVRFAQKGRMLGLGVLGYHSLLQSKMLPFDSFETMKLNNIIFKTIREKADKATRQLAVEYGEPEWCKGFGVRNTHLLAVAPTVTNSIISGNVSAGIEPIAANAFVRKGSTGATIQRNPQLAEVLEARKINTEAAWQDIIVNEGSVQHLALSEKEKEVFLTAREINQLAIVRQAAQRQKYIDQAQSLNLFFPVDVDPKFFNKVHIEAWKSGVKTLYYVRTGSVLKGDVASRSECKACEA